MRASDRSPAATWSAGWAGFIGLVGSMAVVAVWWATGPWGPGLSPDAVAYTATAEGIRDHASLGYWLEPSMSSWPPLFPLVLAGCSTLFDVSAVDAGRVVNALCQGATVVVVAVLARRLLRNAWLCALAIVCAAVAQPLAFVTVKVWSEPLFNLLVLAGALVLSTAPGRRSTARLLVASAIVVAAFMTRYAGLVFVPAGVAVVTLWPRSSLLSDRIRRAILFGGPALAAGGLLVIWNRWRTGETFGPRWRPDEPFWNHASDGLGSIGQWWLPADSPRQLTVLVGFAVLASVTFVVVRSWHRDPAEADDASATESSIGVAPVLAVFTGSYFVYMVWARTTSGFDPLSSRLMLPMFLPALLLILWLVELWASHRPQGVPRTIVLGLPVLLLLPSMVGGLGELRTTHAVGNEYTNAAVRRFVASPVLNRIPTDCALTTNDPWLLWLAGVEAQLTPEEDREVAIPQSMMLDDLVSLVSSTSTCLVWFDSGSTVFYEPTELATVVRLDEVASDDFTTVYRLSPSA